MKHIGNGVYEIREHFGSGGRMYYVQQGKTLIAMLAGGDKSPPSKDIEQAKKRARQLGSQP